MSKYECNLSNFLNSKLQHEGVADSGKWENACSSGTPINYVNKI